MPTRKQDAKTEKKNYCASLLPSCWAHKNRSQIESNVSTRSNWRQPKKQRASSDFSSMTFSSTIIGRISSEILSEHDEFVA